MKTYYKATRLDGTDFYTGTVDYASALESGKRVRVNTPAVRGGYSCCSGDVLHAADVPTETLIGGLWPCRLFEVTGRPIATEGHKFGFRSLKVEREIDAHLALGPQGALLSDLIGQASRLTERQVDRLYAAWNAAWDAAWNAARNAAWALCVRDLIGSHGYTQAHYDTLTAPWRKAVGPIHPDDEDLR